MDKEKRVDEMLTLGAYVSELHPGSACVCCGTPLERTDVQETAPWNETLRRPTEETQVLSCPDCGCEVGGLFTRQVASRRSRTLNQAA